MIPVDDDADTLPETPVPEPAPAFFPDAGAIASELVAQSHESERRGVQPVRLQVYPGETGWALRWGDPSWDTDHHGYWGASYAWCPMTQARALELADELRDQALDHYFIR